MGLGEHPYRLGPTVLSLQSLTDKIDNNVIKKGSSKGGHWLLIRFSEWALRLEWPMNLE